MRSISTILVVLLVCAGIADAQTNVSYRLISSHRSDPTDTVKESEYNVSVDRYLDVSAVKNVICQLVRNEKPQGYEVLSIGIYYKLGRYTYEIDIDMKDVVERRERRIAQYHWNKDSPKDSRRLVIPRDAKGQPLKEWRFYNFDHSKDCR